MHKLYVLVRSDISKSQQAVQAGHAVAAHMLKYPGRFENGTLVYLRVEDLQELEEIWSEFIDLKVDHATFFEPDLNDDLTSISFIGNRETLPFTQERRLV